MGSKVDCYMITLFWQLHRDQIESYAEAREEAYAYPWGNWALHIPEAAGRAGQWG